MENRRSVKNLAPLLQTTPLIHISGTLKKQWHAVERQGAEPAADVYVCIHRPTTSSSSWSSSRSITLRASMLPLAAFQTLCTCRRNKPNEAVESESGGFNFAFVTAVVPWNPFRMP